MSKVCFIGKCSFTKVCSIKCGFSKENRNIGEKRTPFSNASSDVVCGRYFANTIAGR